MNAGLISAVKKVASIFYFMTLMTFVLVLLVVIVV